MEVKRGGLSKNIDLSRKKKKKRAGHWQMYGNRGVENCTQITSGLRVRWADRKSKHGTNT